MLIKGQLTSYFMKQHLKKSKIMKLFIQVYCIILTFLIIGCSQNTKEVQCPLFEKKTIIKSDNIKSTQSASFVYNIVKKDSSIILMLSENEKILFGKCICLDTVSKFVSLWLIPTEEPILKYYLLALLDSSNVLSCIKIKAEWIDNDENEYVNRFRFLSPPLIYMEDITGDGNVELVLKDRQHIGNVYNAAVKHYFSLNNMKIKYIGSFEYISYLPVEEKYLVRSWDSKSKIVNVFLKKRIYSNDSVAVGNYKMEIRSDTIYQYDFQTLLLSYEQVLLSTK